MICKMLTFSLGIFQKYVKTIDEVRSAEWIAANPYAQRLPKSNNRGLMDCFISQCPRSRDYANNTLLMCITGHNPYFALPWLENDVEI